MSLPPINPQQLNYAPPPPRNDLRDIAVRQRALNLCILGYICGVLLLFAVPVTAVKIIAGLGLLAAAVTGAVFVFMLALALYGTGLGVFMGILSLIPYVGIVSLLIVNGKATKTLRAHGITVGLLGADPRQLPPAS